MKVLLVLNYQREIPPFWQIQIKYARVAFDRIIFITAKLRNDNSNTIASDSIKIIQISKFQRFLSCLYTLLFTWFKPYFWKELCHSEQSGIFFFKRVKHLLTISFVTNNIYKTAKTTVKQTGLCSEITVFAGWFANEALAAGLLKKKFPMIKTYSFAHSFEIHPGRNPLMPYCYNYFKHNYVDRVFFISDTMRQLYDEGTGCKYHDLLKEKSGIHYLGTQRLFNESGGASTDGVFRICSCSSMVPLKRLSLLLEALEYWNAGKIVWTHLGGGPLYNSLVEYANKICETNKNIEIVFRGKIPNNDVQRFYANNPIDLFINISEVEGLPVSIMEATSYAIPVLATDVGGTKEIVDNSNGCLVPASITPEELLSEIKKFVFLTQDKKQNLRSASWSVWNNKFNSSSTGPIFWKSI